MKAFDNDHTSVHMYFREWMRENRVKLSDLGKVVGKKNISYYTATDKPFPIEWLMAWQEQYGWTDQQLFRFAFGKGLKGNSD